jgi:hypothetical protein
MTELRLTEHAVAPQERPAWIPVEEPVDRSGPIGLDESAGPDPGMGNTLPNGDPPAWMLWGVEEET